MDRFSLTSAPATNFRRQREGGEGRRSKCRLSLSSSSIVVPSPSSPLRTLYRHPFSITLLCFLFQQFHSIFLSIHLFFSLFTHSNLHSSHFLFFTFSHHLYSSSPFKPSCLPVLPRTKTPSPTNTHPPEGGKEGVGGEDNHWCKNLLTFNHRRWACKREAVGPVPLLPHIHSFSLSLFLPLPVQIFHEVEIMHKETAPIRVDSLTIYQCIVMYLSVLLVFFSIELPSMFVKFVTPAQ